MTTPIKNLIWGVGLAVLINCIYVSSSFTVGKAKLLSSEICLVKAFLQVLVFSLIIIWKTALNLKTEDPYLVEVIHSNRVGTCFWVLIYCLATGGMSYTAYIGVKTMPVPDFVVFGHTAPAFTLLLSICVLGQRLTLLNAGLCIAVIIGVILVVQPSFLFHSVAHLNYPMYSLGVVIAFLCAFSAALINVSSAKLKTTVSRYYLMLYGGFATGAIGLLGHFFTALEQDSLIPMHERAFMTVGVSISSIIGGHLLVIANQNAPPIVIAVVRATEIVMALIVDEALSSKNEEENLSLHVVGAVLVLSSVSLMAASEYIQRRFDECRSKSDKLSDSPTVKALL